jgi:hypothetical protein
VCVGWMDLPGTALSHSSLLGPPVGDRSSSLGGIPMLGCCRVSASALVQGPPDPAVRGLLGSVDEFRERHASARKAAGVVFPPGRGGEGGAHNNGASQRQRWIMDESSSRPMLVRKVSKRRCCSDPCFGASLVVGITPSRDPSGSRTEPGRCDWARRRGTCECEVPLWGRRWQVLGPG